MVSVREISEKLQKASEVAIAWGRQNDVQFDVEKTEALLFNRKKGREPRRTIQEAHVHTVKDRKQGGGVQPRGNAVGVWDLP
jgi:hypothetical protein